MNEVKNKLDSLVEQYNTPGFINNDPVQFPRQYTKLQDIEVAAFLASTIAWGNRKQILTGCKRMLHNIMKDHPFDFVMNDDWKSIDPTQSIHRTFFGRDLAYMCKGLKFAYITSGTWDSLERFFVESGDVWQGFNVIRDLFAYANDGIYSRHFSNPNGNRHKGGSACKRLNLMLRWLCRQDGIVDLGVWHDFKPGQLMMPLDTHVARVGREMGLIERKSNDRITVEELTDKLRDFDINDPCKYDFALFGLGESQKHK